VKKARKEGRLAEAMLDRRAAMKRCVTLSIPCAVADRQVIDMLNDVSYCPCS
jgi:hypothetical protein